MSESQQQILAVRELCYQIGETHILNSLSFSVGKGETVGVIGPNGSGKTTLFNCLSGFARPQSGTIQLAGKDITAAPPSRRALLGLGRVFQNCGVFREMTVLENILVALESRQPVLSTFLPFSPLKKRNEKTALEWLAQVKLDGRAKERASSLSGGQLRLLEIIRSLAFGAELFLLDEPTAGVSPKMKEDVAQLIRHLKSLGKTVLVIEHDLNFIQSFSDRVIVLDVGSIVLDAAPSKVREDPRLQEIYFGGNNRKTG